MRWLIFAFALLQSTIGTAAIFGSDDRMTVSSRTAEGRAVGTATYGSRRTTAFLVDKCFAVTSQHLISTVASPLGQTVALAFGRVRVSARAVRAGHMERERHGYRDDWLLLQLDRCQRKGPVLELADEDAARPTVFLQAGFELSAIGFPLDRNRLVADPTCRIRAAQSYGLLNDCAAQPGSSGSPLVGRQGRRLIAYAIQSGALPTAGAEAFTTARANIATPVAAVRQALLEERFRLASDITNARRAKVRMAVATPLPQTGQRANPAAEHLIVVAASVVAAAHR